MVNNIQLAENSKCTGCTACYNACAKGAITMTSDEAGFRYPHINKDICVGCHACEKSCPVINITQTNQCISSYFLAQTRNKDYINKCASGGAFATIANYVIEKGGVVIGAAYDDNYNVRHIYAENPEELKPLLGSKYVQSELGDLFKSIKSKLLENRLVCFSGTPCQVAGLKAYLGKTYDKLITVDFLCHSIAAPKAFQLYKKKLAEKYGEIKDIRFKSKKYGYSFPSTEVTYLKGSSTRKIYLISQKDEYLYAFLHGKISRNSCDNCYFRNNHRSDITIADYYMTLPKGSKLQEEEGLSRVFVWNEKEKELLNVIKSRMIVHEMNIEAAFVSADFANHSTSKIDFGLLDSQDEESFYKHFFVVPFKNRILGDIRVIMQKLHLQKTLKHLLKR